ncbi:MAG: hypothetical protein GXO90_03975, partial [FCB group bacterium]|nr:hypothetical protein [FCB group bacterium]
MSGQRLFWKSVLIFIFNFGLCLGADDLPPELANIFTVERTQELSGEALYADIADETGDYVLILKKNNSENTVKYFTADGIEKWQKDFARKEAVWIDITENSETVMVQGWGIVNIFDKEGGLLFTKQRNMTSYFL